MSAENNKKEKVEEKEEKKEEVPKKPVFEVEKPVKMYTAETLPNKRIVFGTQVVLEKEKP